MNSLIELTYQSPWLWLFWALFLFGILFFQLPIIVRRTKETIQEYKEILRKKPKHVREEPSYEELETKLNELNKALEAYKNDALVREMRELREILGNNPEKILSVQRLTFEIESIQKDLDAVKSNNRWLMGVIFTLVFGVLATVATLIASSINSGGT
jgi:alanyl-tRNA synthetase